MDQLSEGQNVTVVDGDGREWHGFCYAVTPPINIGPADVCQAAIHFVQPHPDMHEKPWTEQMAPPPWEQRELTDQDRDVKSVEDRAGYQP